MMSVDATLTVLITPFNLASYTSNVSYTDENEAKLAFYDVM